MSMEERCQQFHADAQKPWDPKKSPKEIDRLKKFLYRNQEHRFTDREQSWLFQSVQCHVTAAQGPGAAQADDEDDNPALALVEDALKMPFTVFTTSQKKTMLKWLDKLRGASGDAQGGKAAGQPQQQASQPWSVMGITGGCVSLMNDDGDECEVQLAGCGQDLVQELQQQFDAGEAVQVHLDSSGKSVVRVFI